MSTELQERIEAVRKKIKIGPDSFLPSSLRNNRTTSNWDDWVQFQETLFDDGFTEEWYNHFVEAAAPKEHRPLVIIQATPFCNIDCKYCYLPDRLNTTKISGLTLSSVYKRIFESKFSNQPFTIVWHAGEPLIMPIQFYEKAFALAKIHNSKQTPIIQSIQTNGTLIDQDWCDFFKANKVSLGISLDGPEDIHDANRVDRKNRGTFNKVMRGVHLLQENDIPFHVLAVVSDRSLEDPDQIWHFFIQNGITKIGFNVEEIEGVHNASSLEGSSTPERYKQFFLRLLQLREINGNKVYVRELDNAARRVLLSANPPTSSESTPLHILNFDCYGNFSTFSPELLTQQHPRYGRFIFGNVFEDAIDDIYANPKFRQIHKAIQSGIEACRINCSYFDVCGGGAPSNKLAENGDFDTTETMACRLRFQATTNAFLEYSEGKINTTV